MSLGSPGSFSKEARGNMEDCVSALFQAGGYYVEKNIREEEVLELDAIITKYSGRDSLPEIRLVEVKSGDWGFSDLFKVRGWMDYLNLTAALFIVTEKKHDMNFFREKAKKLGIELKTLSVLRSDMQIQDIDYKIWKCSNQMERKLLERLKHYKKCHQDKKCFSALAEYYSTVNDKIFFMDDILERVTQLYQVFEKFSHISAKCGNELMGKSFDEDCSTLPKEIYEKTYYVCDADPVYKISTIHISTFVEHRARLAILKSAVDYILDQKNEMVKDQKYDLSLREQGFTVRPTLDELPASFREGLQKIAKDKYFHRYPIFWQWFMWAFGGFILRDYEEKEYEILSHKTGIPVDEIPNALKSYEILFPIKEQGWFLEPSSESNIKLMKMLPVPFMGIGALYRAFIYTESKELNDLKTTGKHTLNDLLKWHTLFEKYLSESKCR